MSIQLAEMEVRLFFHNFDASSPASDFAVRLDGFNPTNIYADGRIELQRSPTWSRLRTAEHHTNFFSELVDEDNNGFGFI